MLKRIKIRGKLLLMLLAPLLAVLLFAYSGATDRASDASAGTREARVAEFVDATAELSTALQIERFNTLIAGRLMLFTAELRPDEVATDEALSRWLGTTSTAWDDIRNAELLASMEETRLRLIEEIDADRRQEMSADQLADELQALASALNDITRAADNEATSVELFRSLDAARGLLTIQEELVAIANVGDRAVVDGQLPSSAPVVLASASNNITLAYDEVYASLDGAGRAAMDELLADDLLPRLIASDETDNRGGFNPTLEIGRAINLGLVEGSISWTAANEERLAAVSAILGDVLSTTAVRADAAAGVAQDEATQFLVLAAGVVLLALLMAIAIGRSVSRPLTQLTNTAHRLSSEELPAMVEAMRTAGQSGTPSMTPIRARGRDEVAQLSRAFAEIQSVTVEVAEEQGNLLRRGISDIFVNLARRNQSLLDRQIDFIDQLESREENPDQLENLFRLDHLATRMRRNAESLLVLAGAEPTRRRGRPVELGDVVRVAMGEIEDFSRIHLVTIDGATVAGSVAVDLAHLLSELMENATQFSPPDTDVDVVGQRAADGTYQITLTDHGIGMSADQVHAANTTLAEPPLIGLELSRSLGFTVVSRLAHRLGVHVRLTPNPEGGLVAVVAIPAEMVGLPEEPTPAPTPPVEIAAAPSVAPPTEIEPPLVPQPSVSPAESAPAVEPQPSAAAPATAGADERAGLAALPTRRPQENRPEPMLPDAPAAVTPLPTRPVSSAPEPVSAPPVPEPAAPRTDGDLFEVVSGTAPSPTPPTDPAADLFSVLDAGEPTGPAPTVAPAAPPPVPAAPPTAEVADSTPPPAAPLSPEVFAPRQPSVAPVEPLTYTPASAPEPPGTVDQSVTSAGLIRRTPKQVEVPQDSMYDPSAAPAQPAMASGTRSPEEVRQMLSRYRAGLRKGRGPEQGQRNPNRRS